MQIVTKIGGPVNYGSFFYWTFDIRAAALSRGVYLLLHDRYSDRNNNNARSDQLQKKDRGGSGIQEGKTRPMSLKKAPRPI